MTDSILPTGEVSRSLETARLTRSLWLRSLFGSSVKMTSSLALDPIATLADRLREFSIPRGEALFNQGNPTEAIHFIVHGVVSHGDGRRFLYRAGEILGFVDTMMDRPHAHTATVVEDAVVLRLAVEDWIDFLEEHFDVLRSMIAGNLRGVGWERDIWVASNATTEALAAYDEGETMSGTFVRRLLTLRGCGLFHKASIQSLSQLLRRTAAITANPGARLPTERLSQGLFVVSRGTMDAHFLNAEGKQIVEYAPAELVCSLHPLTKSPEEFSFVARTPTELLWISSEVFFDVMEDHFDLARSALAYLAHRVEQANVGDRRVHSDDLANSRASR